MTDRTVRGQKINSTMLQISPSRQTISTLHPLLHKIKDNCKLFLHAWYLDDGTVIGDSKEVVRVLDIINLREGLFPVDIRRPSSGAKLLGELFFSLGNVFNPPYGFHTVSKDADFISGLAMRRDANAVDLMSLLPQLHDPQSELILLRSCMGIAKLFFGLRTCQPVHMKAAALFLTKDFLLVIPIDGLGQHMSPVEYRTILKYRVMIPLFSVNAKLPICRKACLDSFGEHVVHYKELLGFKYRHDMVMDILFDICRCAGISAKKEAPVNLLTDPSDGRSTLRPVDVLVFEWVGGKHACVYLTGVSPLVRLSSRGFTVGQAALKVALCKVTKHEKTCIENQRVFIPFAFDKS
uniref:Putative reverse transcriptase domain, PPM-type phosphatase domain, protein phosphatase 2C family n=1 Tax=Tanacetum cinerariifolium TaxID=118510 RepID=A0A6L2NUN9_TANCI|nr:putative reverse transcriptase domain, PPM-type phosphatase domain, protein phosphatase 2C family [Tanacetum cinerariifolium]